MSTVSVNKVIPKDNNKLTLGNSGQAVVADGTLTLSANTKVTRMDAIQSAGDRRVIIGSNTQHLDSARGKYGTSGDLQIYHDGSNSYVEDAGTGILVLKANQLNVNTTGDAGMISAVEGAAVQLYHGGNVKLATTSTGTSVTGKVVATGPVTTPIVSANTASSKKGIFTGPVTMPKITANTANFTALDVVTLQADAIDFDGDVTVDAVTANTVNATAANFTTLQADAIDFDGDLTVDGVTANTIVANGGITVDNITIDGTEIDLSSGDLTLDVAGNIFLNADGGDIRLVDGSTQFGVIQNNSSDLVIQSSVSAKDIILKGNDSGGSAVTAATFDMSASGDLTLGRDLYVRYIYGASDGNTGIQWEGSDQLTFHAGGTEIIAMVSNAITFNQDGADVDFRVEGDTDTELFFIDAGSEKVAIGTSTVAGFLRINKNFQSDIAINLDDNSGSGGTAIRFKINGTTHGSIAYSASGTSFNTSSDYRLKENVSYDWDATSRLKQLKPARFNWISDDTNTVVDGFLAHEVSDIVPEAIWGDKDGTQDIGTIRDKNGKVKEENVPESVKENKEHTWTKTGTENVYQEIDQDKLIPLLVKSLQEAVAKIETLETKVATLEGE